jgi:hypothetical protein
MMMMMVVVMMIMRMNGTFDREGGPLEGKECEIVVLWLSI